MALGGSGRVFEDLRDGTYRQQLEALRDRLALEIDKPGCLDCGRVDARELASLTKELREVIRALDALPIPNSGSRLDEIQAQRDKRRNSGGAELPPVNA